DDDMMGEGVADAPGASVTGDTIVAREGNALIGGILRVRQRGGSRARSDAPGGGVSLRPMLDNHLHRFCGGRYQRAVETVTIRVSGMSAEVQREFFRCAKCGDEQRTVEQRESAERAAIERIRSEHGLLLPKEIRHLRELLG